MAEGSELAPLAQALDDMRKDLLIKIELLESSHAAVQRLNEDLRFQLNQRLRRLMDISQETEIVETRKNVGLLAQGERLGDSYRVVTMIAARASGSVYEVVRTTDGRKLAAKVLTKQSERAVTARFVAIRPSVRPLRRA